MQPFFLMGALEIPAARRDAWAALSSRVGASGGVFGCVLVDGDFHASWAAFEQAMPDLAAAGGTGWVASWSAGTGELDLLVLEGGACQPASVDMDGRPEMRVGAKRARRQAPETLRAVREAWATLYRRQTPGVEGLDEQWPPVEPHVRAAKRRRA